MLEGACAPSYLEVRLAPLAAYTVLGVPMDGFGEHVVDLIEVFGADGGRLAEQVREAPDWPRRFAPVDAFLWRRLDAGRRPAPEVSRAWRLMAASGGTMEIRRMADDVGWSHKHLITQFRRQVGLPPKTAARLVRFQRLLGRLERAPAAGWDELAADCGYADQAHLGRDFRAFAGTTPTAFRAEATATGRLPVA
ncbi:MULTISPECIES: helix-turn-helix domain-containing protein [unclassified Streptomyces]|uniref:AraC family transcriptional regulator n=1 Tax=unclassified Streptomyces TaxID=2593676 RepID=UPI00069B8F71|nr:helix-turn-helix domain-containing protein [Streptomyces sp. CNQ-509]